MFSSYLQQSEETGGTIENKSFLPFRKLFEMSVKNCSALVNMAPACRWMQIWGGEGIS